MKKFAYRHYSGTWLIVEATNTSVAHDIIINLTDEHHVSIDAIYEIEKFEIVITK